MKKTYSLLLALSIFVFTSCGGDEKQPDPAPVVQAPVNEPTNTNPPVTTPPVSPVEPPATPPPITTPEGPTSAPIPVPMHPVAPSVPPIAPGTSGLDPSLHECVAPAIESVTVVYAPDRTSFYPFVATCGDLHYIVWSLGHSEQIAAFNQAAVCANPEFVAERMDGEFYDLSAPDPSPDSHFPACGSYVMPGYEEYPIEFTPTTCNRLSSYENQCSFFLTHKDGRLQVGMKYLSRSGDTISWRNF